MAFTCFWKHASKQLLAPADFQTEFTQEDEDWGIECFMTHAHLRRGFLVRDTVIIKVVIRMVQAADSSHDDVAQTLSIPQCPSCKARQEASRQLKSGKKSIQQQLSEALSPYGEEHQKRLDLQAQHDALIVQQEALQNRRATDGATFDYRVRGSQQTGSVPRHIFDREPDSALARMYNSEWEYAKDESGRANVNSNPAHWEIILDWLSFGTVPSKPSSELLSECRFWQLHQLLSRIEPTEPSIDEWEQL